MLPAAAEPLTILAADDDEDDRLLLEDALEASGIAVSLHCVEDGEELLDYLGRRGRYVRPQSSPRPALILLDLNMPRLDGRAALKAIRRNSVLRGIPVLVLTTSHHEADLRESYKNGATSYIVKPSSYEELVELLRVICAYWLRAVELPPVRAGVCRPIP